MNPEARLRELGLELGVHHSAPLESRFNLSRFSCGCCAHHCSHSSRNSLTAERGCPRMPIMRTSLTMRFWESFRHMVRNSSPERVTMPVSGRNIRNSMRDVPRLVFGRSEPLPVKIRVEICLCRCCDSGEGQTSPTCSRLRKTNRRRIPRRTDSGIKFLRLKYRLLRSMEPTRPRFPVAQRSELVAPIFHQSLLKPLGP